MNFSVDEQTKVEFHGEEIEPEIVIRTSDGLLVEIFGTKGELKTFAKNLHETVNSDD